jgi:Methyltransferase domain
LWATIRTEKSTILHLYDQTFEQIFTPYDTDKVTHHSYGEIYDFTFNTDDYSLSRASVSKVLEIGIYRGGSLYGWRDYFPNADIHGIDINPDYLITDTRIQSHLVDCRDALNLSRFARTYGPFDFIVDDGPHDPSAQIITLLYLWEHLTPGGVYAIEDILGDKYFNIANYYSYFPGQVHDRRHISDIRNDIILIMRKVKNG